MTAASDFADSGGMIAAEVSGVATESAVALRWFRFAAGSTPEDDYRPVGSEGVGLKLLAELAQVCVAFHPHNDIRQFPKRRPVLLFFRANATGDSILLRIGLHRSAEGERLSLQYDGLILSATDLRYFGLDPFAPGDWKLFDRVQRAATTDAAGARLQVTRDAMPPSHALPTDADDWTFTSGTERVASDDEVDALERLCRLKAARGVTSPFFATWWESGKPVPPGYFDLVLRAPSPRGLTPRAVEETATRLALDLAAFGETEKSFAFQTHVVSALRSCGKMTPPQFHQAMVDTADELGQIGDTLQAAPELRERCRAFEEELRKLRHPDPFAAGRFDTMKATLRAEAEAANSRRRRLRALRRHRPLLILGGLALLTIMAALAVLVWRNQGHAVR